MPRILLTIALLFPAFLSAQVTLQKRGISPNGPIFDAETVGDIMYAGGSFSRVGYETGGSAYFPGFGEIPEMDFPFVDGEVYAVVSDGNGGWYIGGDFDQVGLATRNNLAHILPNMEVDQAFNFDVSGDVNALAVFNDTILFAGNFTTVGGASVPYLAGVDASSNTLISYPNPPNGQVKALQVVNGNVLVGGSFSRIADRDLPGMALIKPSTGEAVSFPAVASGNVNTFFRKGDTIVIGGSFNAEMGQITGRAAYFQNGTDQATIDFPSVNGTVEVVVEDGVGGWYIGGSFTKIGEEARDRIAHILPDFSVDPNLNLDMAGTVYAISVFNDTILFAGTFTTINGQSYSRMAGADATSGALLAWNPGADGTVKSLVKRGSELFVGGSFSTIAGDKQPRLARLHIPTETSIPIKGPTNGEISVILDHNGELYAGGTFSGASGDFTGNLATFNGLVQTPELQGFDVTGAVEVVVPDGNNGWYIGGGFTKVNGQTQTRLAHILANGTLDPAFSFTVNNVVKDILMWNDTMMIAGAFTQIDGVSHGRMAIIDMNTGTVSAWNPDANGTVETLHRMGNTIYAGGAFTSLFGQTRNRMGSFDGTFGLTSWDPDANGTVNKFLEYSGQIYALGNFSTIGGVTKSRVAELNPTTGALGPLTLSVIGSVNTGAVFNDTMLFGGTFFQVNGQARSRLAGVDLVNGTLTSWDPGASSTVNFIAAWNDTMMIGGNFTTLGGQARTRVGAVKADGTVLAWNPSPNNQVYTIARQGSQWLLGGNFSVVNSETRSRFLKLDQNFAIDAFNPAPNGNVRTMASDGGFLFLGGSFTNIGGTARNRLASFNLGSATLEAFDPGADGEVFDLKVFNDTIMVAGNFQQIAGQQTAYFAAINIPTGQLQPWFQPDPNAKVNSFARSGGGILSGGTFVAHKSEARSRAAAYDMSTGSLLSFAPNITGFGARVNDVSVFNDTILLIGGAFNGVDGQTRNSLFSMSLNGNLQAFDPAPNDEVFAVMVSGDSVLVGGEFTQISGEDKAFGAVLNPLNGNTGSWTPGSEWAVRTFMQDGNDLLVMGEFSMVRQQAREDAFAMNLRTGKLLPWNPQGGFLTVSGLKTDPDRNRVFLYGFDSGSAQHVKAVDVDSGAVLPLPPITFNAAVNAIDIDPNTGVTYIGGGFDQVNGMPQKSLVAIDSTGNILPFSVNLDDEVRGIVVWDSTIYLAGGFTTIEGESRNKAAAVSLKGELRAWDPNLNTFLFTSLGNISVQSDRVYIAGGFTTANGEARDRLVAVDPISGSPLRWDPKLNGTNRNFAIARNNRVFVAGDMTDASGTSVQGLVSIGGISGRVRERMPSVGLNDVFDLAWNDTMMVAVGNFTSMEGGYHPYVATYSYSGANFGSRLESYAPKVGGNNGDVTISINGNNFGRGTRIALRSPSLGTILPYDSSLVIYGGTRIEATFNLRGASLGIMDLVIRIPGDTTIVIDDGFEIVQGTEPEPWADLVAPAFVTARKKEFVYLSYGNTGNIDAHGVPLFIAFSENVEILDMSYRKIEILDSTQNWTDSLASFVTIDTLLGRPYKANVYSFFIPKIAAGSSKMIRIRTKGDKSGKFFMRAWTTDPMYGSPLKYYVGECLDALIFQVVGFVPFAGCAAGIVDAMLSPGFDLAYDPDFGSSSWWTSYLEGIAGTAIGCGLDFTTGGAGRIAVELVDLILKYKAAGELSEKCFRPEEKEDTEGEYVESSDPNDKTGLRGYGGNGWLTTNRKFPYMIRYENDPMATAPAKLVIIRDTLDPAVFDFSTLESKGFAIGDTFFTFPAGIRTGSTIVDLRPFQPVYVEVTTTLNTANGEYVWTIEGLDTLTLAPLTGALEGFLPPNTDTLSGQGAVFFDIKPKDNIATGTTIWNEAAIYFDFNPPIITDPWVLTADNHRPESNITPMPDTVFSSPVSVSWTGTDVGSGIQHVDVLMRINGDRWQFASVALSDTTFDLDVLGGNTYELYTVAFDSALNREVAYPIADETFFVAQGVNVEDELNPIQLTVYPNPGNGEFMIDVDVDRSGPLELQLLDLMGREVDRQEFMLTAGSQSLSFNTDAPDGVYLLRYQIGSQIGTKKLQIAR